MVCGLWSMVYGLWSMVYGLWSMVEGRGTRDGMEPATRYPLPVTCYLLPGSGLKQSGYAAFAVVHHFHHLAHLIELSEEFVEFLDVSAAAANDALFAGVVQDFGFGAFFGGH